MDWFNKNSSDEVQNNDDNSQMTESIPTKISELKKLIDDIFGNTSDIVVEEMKTCKENVIIIYIDGLVNTDLIDRDIIKYLKSDEFNGDVSKAIKANFKKIDEMQEFIKRILNGYVGVFYENSKNIILIELKNWRMRAVEEPAAEAVVRGPKEGFTEDIRTNTALIRRKLKTPDLRIESMVLGKQTNTSIGIVYIKGIVNEDILKEVNKRVSAIDTDIILESGHIEQYIEENKYSPISGMGLTQKPDVLVQRISEGRVAILCDGTPHALTIPELLVENLYSTEDYYNRVVFSTIIRIFRVFGLFITVMLPGLAVAILTFHQEMIPSVFLNNIINSSQQTPMTMSAEVLLLTFMFQLLKEAGTRLPKAVGSAVTIVGSLIVGDTAVSAGIVSAPMVIIVALTAVTSFMAPSLDEFTLVYRTLYWLLGSIMGLIGIGTAVFIMLTQLISTQSFGIPILSSFSKNELKDGIIRFPLQSLKFRPSSIAKNNIIRR